MPYSGAYSGQQQYDTMRLIPADTRDNYAFKLNHHLGGTTQVTPATLAQRQSMSNLGIRSTRGIGAPQSTAVNTILSSAKLNTTFTSNYKLASDLFCMSDSNLPRNTSLGKGGEYTSRMKLKMGNTSFTNDKENLIKHNNFMNLPLSTKNYPYDNIDKYNPLNTHQRVTATVCSPKNELRKQYNTSSLK